MTLTTPYGTLDMTAQECIALVTALLKDAPADVLQGVLALPYAALAAIKEKAKEV